MPHQLSYTLWSYVTIISLNLIQYREPFYIFSYFYFVSYHQSYYIILGCSYFWPTSNPKFTCPPTCRETSLSHSSSYSKAAKTYGLLAPKPLCRTYRPRTAHDEEDDDDFLYAFFTPPSAPPSAPLLAFFRFAVASVDRVGSLAKSASCSIISVHPTTGQRM